MTSAAGVADCALSRRKQGFESPRERHPRKSILTSLSFSL
jgi:hypothetical protein